MPSLRSQFWLQIQHLFNSKSTFKELILTLFVQRRPLGSEAARSPLAELRSGVSASVKSSVNICLYLLFRAVLLSRKLYFVYFNEREIQRVTFKRAGGG